MLVVAEAGLMNDDDVLSLNVASFLMSDMEAPLENFGKIESFGAYFLEKGYLDSQSILVFSSISKQLDASYLVMSQNLSSIFDRFEEANRSEIINISLLEVIPNLLIFSQDAIVIDPELEMTESEYRIECHAALMNLYKFQDQLIESLLSRYQTRIDSMRIDQWQRALSIGVLVFGAMYLFMGIFYSVEHSLLQLISAAERVSSGDLDTKVEIKTRDELYQLSRVFEEMRVQLKARDQALFDLAITDGLTGLFNRKYFNDCINLSLKNASRSNCDLTLIIIDIDFFKNLNDTYGHQAGDTVLIKVADMIATQLRHHDTLARFGGEEFITLLNDTDEETALIISQRIIDKIRELDVDVGDQNIKVTISIGCITYQPIRNTVINVEDISETLIKQADDALYIAKDSGRDQVISSGIISK